MTTWVQAQGRMLRSARAIKAYFEQKLQTSLELLTEAPAEIRDGDVQFSNGMGEYGLWGVRSESALKEHDRTEISETFESVFGGLAEQRRKSEALTELQGRLAQTTEELPSNVIPLRRTGIPARTPVNDRRWILRLDCLIESKHVSEIHKMALELHAHSRRYAFVDFRDLSACQRTSVPELLTLGGITLFIPDLLLLSFTEQEALRELMQKECLHRPLLMVGTTIPYAELRSVAGVHTGFLVSLSRAYIKLSKPFSEYKEQGLIRYFLDSLSESPI